LNVQTLITVHHRRARQTVSMGIVVGFLAGILISILSHLG
jgi:hypothetical protein